MKHTDTCATGARAERRGPCDCGAVDTHAYGLKITDDHKVELHVLGRSVQLLPMEAGMLAIQLHEAGRIAVQQRIAADERAERKRARREGR